MTKAKDPAAYVEVGKGTLDAMVAGKPQKSKRPSGKAAPASEKKARLNEPDVKTEEVAERVGSGRQAAQNLYFKEEAARTSHPKDDYIVKREVLSAASEAEAWTATAPGVPQSQPLRRLVDYCIHSATGVPEPLEALRSGSSAGLLRFSGVVAAPKGDLASEATPQRRVEGVQELLGFEIVGGRVQDGALASQGAPALVLVTGQGRYELSRPAQAYRRLAADAQGLAELVVEVRRALKTDPELGLEGLVARLARAGRGKGYASARDALLLNARAVLGHLGWRADGKQTGGEGVEEHGRSEGKQPASGLGKGKEPASGLGKGKEPASGVGKGKDAADAPIAGLSALDQLHREAEQFRLLDRARQEGEARQGGGIRMAGGAEPAGGAKPAGGTPGSEPDADEEFARKLQAQMDAEEAQRARKVGGGSRGAYVKVSESEIAEDYPPPRAYDKEEEEVDELVLADEACFEAHADDLPRRVLADFSIYNAEGLLASLELLPMLPGVDSDAALFASGLVCDESGDFFADGTGHALGEEKQEGGDQDGELGGPPATAAAPPTAAPHAAAAPASTAGSSSSAPPEPRGLRLFLSQIREWEIECGPEVLLLSLRTDVAWYRLATPAPAYSRWFAPVLRTARLATRALELLGAEPRASRLSLADVLRRLAALPPSDPAFVSAKPERVGRWMAVHAQIALQLFATWPVKALRRCAFVTALRERMLGLRHVRLGKGAPAAPPRRANANPMRDRATGRKAKPMTATATRMVRGVWQSYFASEAAEGKEGGAEEAGRAEDREAEERAAPVWRPPSVAEVAEDASVEWGPALSASQPCSYRSVRLGGVEISLGDVVLLEGGSENPMQLQCDLPCTESDSESDAEDERPPGREPSPAPVSAAPLLGLVQALWSEAGESKNAPRVCRIQTRRLLHGTETVLGDAAAPDELFVADALSSQNLARVRGLVRAHRLQREWSHERRLEQAAEDVARRGAGAGCVWRRRYLPHRGMFCDLEDGWAAGLGQRLVEEAEDEAATPGASIGPDRGLSLDGEPVPLGACLFLAPEALPQRAAARRETTLPDYLKNSRFAKGSHDGLRAWGVGRLVGVDAGRRRARVRRFYRPEDLCFERAYRADSYNELFASEEEVEVPLQEVVGRCWVLTPEAWAARRAEFLARAAPELREHLSHVPSVDAFVCAGRVRGDEVERGEGESADALALARSAEEASPPPPEGGDDDPAPGSFQAPGQPLALPTMDIFAGCGGLSEGMHQAGAAEARWAIEYEEPAAEAFALNNPGAAVFCDNCNVLLHAAMRRAGREDDCEASPEAAEASEKLAEGEVARLPLPGEVAFICGGPPCQGYSGMNRFNKGHWSTVQNSMVMAFLSYADHFRPRFFLLENVRNFVVHNKGQTFRLTLRSLLDMGYQVRFGVLNAGNFGVAQSRKRTFIWAAAPGEELPDWPRLMHAFRTPQLAVPLGGGAAYAAVPQPGGAPLRPVTVRDAIGDLPAIVNGQADEAMAYGAAPQSAFQAAVRGEATTLTDHWCKAMNELNLERCRCIPTDCPGADWRVLEAIVAADPSRETFKGQALVPWCLPNTADRHNGWRGLFGRLDVRGHFPTSTTDPQPMGKVGQVFHPHQDRIVSVRECARAQGFPDRTRFAGTVQARHRQVGNAVPPPLAAALGRQLRRSLERKARRDAERPSA